MKPYVLLAIVLLSTSLASCGAVSPTADASSGGIDAPPSVDAPQLDAPELDAPASTIDAPVTPIDASVDAPGCVWINVAVCDTNGTIAQFCPSGTHVNQLRRCDNSTYTPDPQYQNFHLCSCQAATCGCNSIGVAWQQVECCND